MALIISQTYDTEYSAKYLSDIRRLLEKITRMTRSTKSRPLVLVTVEILINASYTMSRQVGISNILQVRALL